MDFAMIFSGFIIIWEKQFSEDLMWPHSKLIEVGGKTLTCFSELEISPIQVTSLHVFCCSTYTLLLTFRGVLSE